MPKFYDLCAMFFFTFRCFCVYTNVYVQNKKKERFSQTVIIIKKNKKSMWCFMHEDDVLFSHKISKRYRKERREGFIFVRHIFPFWFGMVSPNIYLLKLFVRVKVIHGNEKKNRNVIYFLFLTQYDKLPKYVWCDVVKAKEKLTLKTSMVLDVLLKIMMEICGLVKCLFYACEF